MKKLTKKKLKSLSPCVDGYEWYLEQNTEDLQEICNLLLKDKKLTDDYLLWLLPRMMNRKQKVQYAVFAAELVVDNFEKEFPDDDRPRKAIEAAKAYIKNQTQANKDAAWSAGGDGDAARSAARSAWSAAWSAGAARSAWSAAWSADAAWSAAWSAGAARSAAWYAAWSAGAAGESEIIYKCAHYGMEILDLEVINEG